MYRKLILGLLIAAVTCCLGSSIFYHLKFSWSSKLTPLPVVRVAAASDLRFALDSIVRSFQVHHPDIDVRTSYGASGNLYAQILEGAPFDIFLAADATYVEQLARQGLALHDSIFVYAKGQLVLWVPKDLPLDPDKLKMGLLLDPSIRRIAIANPRHAPYGGLAEQALRAAGIYQEVASKLVFGDSAAQAAQFLQAGAADAGLIPHSLAAAAPMRAAGRFWVIPEELAPSLVQAGILLGKAACAEAATALRDFLLSEEGQQSLVDQGFILPESHRLQLDSVINEPQGRYGVAP